MGSEFLEATLVRDEPSESASNPRRHLVPTGHALAVSEGDHLNWFARILGSMAHDEGRLGDRLGEEAIQNAAEGICGLSR